MRKLEASRHVVVVGSGIAGLSAAAYLARAGQRVTVLERSSAMGGRARTTQKGDYHLNFGAHALAVRGELSACLDELGVEFSCRRAPASGVALHRERLSVLPTSMSSMLRSQLFGFRGKLEVARVFAKAAQIAAADYRDVSVLDFAEREIRRPEVREWFLAMIRLVTYVNCPARLSAETALSRLQGTMAGVVYVDEGWQTLVDGLARVATKAGARLETGARAVALSSGGEGYRVSVDSAVIEADAVVVAVGPRAAAELVEPLTGRLLDRPDTTVARVCTLDVALDTLPNPRVGFALGIDEPIYYSVHSQTARLAPAGGAMIHVSKYLDPDEEPDDERNIAEVRAVLSRLQPGFERCVVEEQVLPRIRVVSRLDEAKDGGARGRPSVAVPGLDGVCLAGDWVQGGSWLADAAAGSGKRAAAAIVDFVGRSRSRSRTASVATSSPLAGSP